jgi:hypothetical protein
MAARCRPGAPQDFRGAIRLCPICSAVDPIVQVFDIAIELCLVVLPRLAGLEAWKANLAQKSALESEQHAQKSATAARESEQQAQLAYVLETRLNDDPKDGSAENLPEHRANSVPDDDRNDDVRHKDKGDQNTQFHLA